MFRQIFKLTILCFFLPSCSKNKDLAIHKVGNLLFRNSYANLYQENSNEFDSIQKSAPEMILDSVEDSSLINKLEKIGIIKNNTLQLDKLKFKNAQITKESIDDSFKFCTVYYNSKLNNIILEVNASGKKINRIIKNDGSRLQYRAIDLINGGYNEILVFDSYYISNGDNYSLEIYEVK